MYFIIVLVDFHFNEAYCNMYYLMAYETIIKLVLLLLLVSAKKN